MSDKDQKTPPTGAGWAVEIRGYTWHKDGFEFVAKAVVNNLSRLPIKETAATAGKDKPAAEPKPAPVAVALPAPASKKAPKAADLRSGADDSSRGSGGGPKKTAVAAPTPDQPLEKMEHPIWNRVSHVVLYKYEPVEDPDPMEFFLINTSTLSQIAGTGSGGGGGGGEFSRTRGQAGQPAGTPTTSRSWSPLTSATLGAGGRSGGRTLGEGGGGGARAAAGRIQQKNPLLQKQKDGDRSSTADGSATGRRPQRTEFIILFLWKEPIPSDTLLGYSEAVPAQATSPAGGVRK